MTDLNPTQPDPQAFDDAQEALLLAYVEGDATPDERAQVEAIAQSDPGLRQLLDELATDRQSLRSLPIPAPPAGLVDDVMSTLERRMLLDQPIEPAPDPAEARFKITRYFAYAGVAAAVAACAAVVVLPLWNANQIAPTGPAVANNRDANPQTNPSQPDSTQPEDVEPDTQDATTLPPTVLAYEGGNGSDALPLQFVASLGNNTDPVIPETPALRGGSGSDAFAGILPNRNLDGMFDTPANNTPAITPSNTMPSNNFTFALNSIDTAATRDELLDWSLDNNVSITVRSQATGEVLADPTLAAAGDIIVFDAEPKQVAEILDNANADLNRQRVTQLTAPRQQLAVYTTDYVQPDRAVAVNPQPTQPPFGMDPSITTAFSGATGQSQTAPLRPQGSNPIVIKYALQPGTLDDIPAAAPGRVQVTLVLQDDPDQPLIDASRAALRASLLTAN